MKKHIFYYFLAAGLLLNSCANPLDDFVLAVNPTFYKYVINLETVDLLNPDVDVANSDITIEITGPDAAKIYSIDGTKNFKANFGAIELITDKKSEPTAGAPLRFTVNIASNKFKSQNINMVVNEGEFYIAQPVFLLDMSNAPAGTIDVVKTSGTLQANGQLAQPLVLNTDGATGNTSQMTMTIPNDITFLGESGQTLSGGSLAVEVIGLSDTTELAQLAMPNNTGSMQRVEINGEVSDFMFDEGPTFEINMNVGGEKVKGFTGNGVQLNIPLPDHMYNWDENREYQAGDFVGFYSFSDKDSTWKSEDDVLVELVNNQLVINPNITHLSNYRADNKSQRKIQRFLKKLKKLPNNRTRPTRVISLARKLVRLNPKTAKRYNRLVIIKFNPIFFERKLVTSRGFLINRLSNSSTASRITRLMSRRLTSNNPIITVTPTPTGDIEIDEMDDPNALNLGYKLYCKGSNAIVTPPAGVKIMYKAAGSNEGYSLLHTFTGGGEGSDKLQKMGGVENNKNYDFRALFESYQVDTNNVQVIDNKFYEITLPTAACDKLF